MFILYHRVFEVVMSFTWLLLVCRLVAEVWLENFLSERSLYVWFNGISIHVHGSRGSEL